MVIFVYIWIHMDDMLISVALWSMISLADQTSLFICYSRHKKPAMYMHLYIYNLLKYIICIHSHVYIQKDV